MTINIGNLNPWQAYQQQAQVQQAQSGATTSASSTSTGVQNTSTTDLNSGFQAYLQAFALDLQASGIQPGGTAASTGMLASTGTADGTDTIDGSDTLQPGEHHHHHHGGSSQASGSGTSGATTQILQGVSQTAGGLLSTATGTADLTAQALSAYAAAGPGGAVLSGLGA